MIKFTQKNLPENVRARYRYYHQGNTPREVLELFHLERITVCDLINTETGDVIETEKLETTGNLRKVTTKAMALGKCFKKAVQHNKLEVA